MEGRGRGRERSRTEKERGDRQGSFPAGTPGNGVPKVIFTVGTAFPGIQ